MWAIFIVHIIQSGFKVEPTWDSVSRNHQTFASPQIYASHRCLQLIVDVYITKIFMFLTYFDCYIKEYVSHFHDSHIFSRAFKSLTLSDSVSRNHQAFASPQIYASHRCLQLVVDVYILQKFLCFLNIFWISHNNYITKLITNVVNLYLLF
jgi:hypothetical protein